MFSRSRSEPPARSVAATLGREIEFHHRNGPTEGGRLAFAHVAATRFLVEANGVWLRFPLEALHSAFPRSLDTACEQSRADATADPFRLDPEVVEDPRLAVL